MAIYKVDNKVIGELKDGTFTKRVKYSKHHLHSADAWGLEAEIARHLQSQGCHTIRIIDTESNTQYEVSLDTFIRDSFVRQFKGFRPQMFLTLNKWSYTPNQNTLFD